MPENNQNDNNDPDVQESQGGGASSAIFEPDASATPPPGRDALAEFEAYCRSERERRNQYEDDFDAALFDQAVEGVMHKLRAHIGEGF